MEKNIFSPMDVIKRSWKIVKSNFSLMIGLLLISILSSLVFGVFFNYYLTFDIVYFVIFILSIIVSIIVSLAMYKIFLDIIDGKKTEIKQGLQSITLRKFLNSFSSSLLYGLIVMVGLVFFIIPGIIFAVRFQFCILGVVDKDLSAIESLKYSWNITKNNFWRFILLGILSFCLILAGLIALLLGVFIAIMLIEVAYVISYKILSNNFLEEDKK